MQTQVKVVEMEAAMDQLLEMLAERAAEEWLRSQSINNNHGEATNERKSLYICPIQYRPAN